MLPFSQFCLAMKVAAVGPVSQEDASAALQRYKKLEDAAPTMKQVGRYAGIGAVAAPVATVLKDTISGGKPLLGGAGNRLRTLAGNAVAGALTSGGIPLVRAHLDREAEKNTLRKYVAQGVAARPTEPGKVASARQILSAKATGLRRVGQVFSGSRVKPLIEDSAAAVREGSDAFKESKRKGTRANELISWAEKMEPITREPQRHARANARLYREEAQQHGVEGAAHVARGAALKREAKVERRKQVGAIGGTAAAATGAAVGAKKLLGKKDAEKEKTSAMSGVTPAKPWAAGEYADMGKMGERVYAGDLHQLKDQPEWKEFRGLRDKGQYSPLVGAGVGGVVGAGLGALADRKLKGGNGMAVLGGMMGSGTGMLVGKHVRGLQAAPHSDLTAADSAALHRYTLGRLLKEHEGNFKGAAGAPTRGGFPMASEVAPWRQPKLHTAIQHEPQQIVEKMGAARAEWLQKRAGATTPAGRLASSHRVGLPKVSAPPGPSIADTVPTFGQRLPGANKTTIGKRSIREVPTLASTAPTQG